MRTLMEAILARHTGKTPEQVRKDIDRDKILTAAGGQGLRHHRRGPRSSRKLNALPAV